MQTYKEKILTELRDWETEMLRRPGILNKAAKALQQKINNLIPEKVHKTITTVVENIFKGVLVGSNFITGKPKPMQNLALVDKDVQALIKIFRTSAAAEGGFTGAGGILLSFADFPALIGIKIKMLFDIASKYGYDASDYKERLYILHVFLLAFCSDARRAEVYGQLKNWEEYHKTLPEKLSEFDWRIFQQEYRDYLDLAKMAQMIPVIGAAVGVVVNYKLINKLGKTAVNAYHLRLLNEGKL